MTEPEVTLPVEAIARHWPMSRRRINAGRWRNPADTAGRWLRREVARTRSTITADPKVYLVEDCIEHWHLGCVCLTVKARAIIGGQAFGLPERFDVPADALAIPMANSLRRAETWERNLR